MRHDDVWMPAPPFPHGDASDAHSTWYEPDVWPDLIDAPRPEWIPASAWFKLLEELAPEIRREVLADRPSWMTPGQWARHRRTLLSNQLDALDDRRHVIAAVQKHEDERELLDRRMELYAAVLQERNRRPLPLPRPRTRPRQAPRRIRDDELTIARRRKALLDAIPYSPDGDTTTPPGRNAA